MASLHVQAPSAWFFLRRCIDDEAPDHVDPDRTGGVNVPGWKCRGVSQADLWVCRTGDLRGSPAGTKRSESDVLQARPLREAGDHLLCPEDQVLLVPSALILPQEVRSPPHRGLRRTGLLCCSPGRPARGLPTDVGSALSPLLNEPSLVMRAYIRHAPA